MREHILKVAIFDSDFHNLVKVESLMEAFKSERDCLEFSFSKSNSLASLVKKLHEGKEFDIFLVGGLSVSNGIEVLKSVRAFSDKPIILMAEGSNEMALEAFNFHVSNYMLKPITKEVLFPAIHRLIDAMNVKRANAITVKSKSGVIKIPYYKIIYMDTKNHIVYFHLTDGSVVSSKTIRKSFEEYTKNIVEDKRFLRPHYSFVMNMDYIVKDSDGVFEMKNGGIIPVSDSKNGEAKMKYQDYCR